MKIAFHYKLKVNLIRYQTKDSIDFITHEIVFKNENPIIAREKVFDEYQEWINDLYTGIGKINGYTSDKQARIDLQTFIQNKNIKINNEDYDINNPLEYGIGIYFVIDEPYNNPSFLERFSDDSFLDKKGDEVLIHGIGNTPEYNDPFEVSDSLSIEIVYYDHYEYDKGTYERYYDLYDPELDIDRIHILDTPFDWAELNEKNEKSIIDYDNETDKIKRIIAEGEGYQIEFKPALVYNFFRKQGGLSIKYVIAKVICAFMNADGGLLFIGLNDDGGVAGLEYDFSISGDKKPKDFFHLELDSLIEYFFDFSIKPYLSGKFYNIENKDIFVLKVLPSRLSPTFLKKQGEKEFWVRGFGGNRQIKEENKINSYWNNKSSIKEE